MIWATNNRPRTNKTSSHTQIMMVHEPSNMDEPHEIRHRPRKISHSSFWPANRDVAKWTRLPVFEKWFVGWSPEGFQFFQVGVASQFTETRHSWLGATCLHPQFGWWKADYGCGSRLHLCCSNHILLLLPPTFLLLKSIFFLGQSHFLVVKSVLLLTYPLVI